MESFFDICDYFEITPFEFFYSYVENPIILKQIYEQLNRLSNNNLDEFLLILETMNKDDYKYLISFIDRLFWNKYIKTFKNE